MNIPEDLEYTESHEWVRVEDGVATVGISDHAQHELGELVYVELPEIGKALEAGDPAAVVESVKAASDIFAPLGGAVSAVNELLTNDPAKINSDPYGDGWIFKLEIAGDGELDSLLDADGYRKTIG
jgi:glycine cleavage system H protein